MTSTSSTLSLQAQLRSFCDGLEQDVKKLRRITSKTVNAKFKNKHQRQQQEQIVIQEFYTKCRSLHEVSERMMTSLEKEMEKGGCKGENSKNKVVRETENKENGINDSNVNTCTVNDDHESDKIDQMDTSVCVPAQIDEEIFIDPALMDTSIEEVMVDKNEISQLPCAQQELNEKSLTEEGKNGDNVADDQTAVLHVDTEESADKEEIPTESPAQRKSSMYDTNDPKTPSIADMKLSKATCGALSFRMSSGSESDNTSSVEKKFLTSTKSTPQSPAIMEKSAFLKSSSKPKKVTPTRYCEKYDNSCDTPPTPELTNDFATCSLQEVTCSLHPAVMDYLENDRSTLDVFNDPAVTKFPETSNEVGQKSFASSVNIASHSPIVPVKAAIDDDSDEEENVDEGIKTKILKTRRDADGKATEDWIPMIEADEWDKAPMSLKVQISSQDVLNAGISSLNKFIFTHQNKRDESFTLEEMTTIVSNEIGSVSVNVFALSLVHLKRLDLALENSIRVYKVKRFY